MDKKQLGYFGEEAICNYLIKKGYKIISRNFTVKGGEIDIIASIKDIIAFVEVKTRHINSLVNGFEAVTKSKQKLIIKAATKYLFAYPCDLQPRFDVVEVQVDNEKVAKIDYIENAFDTSGYNIIF